MLKNPSLPLMGLTNPYLEPKIWGGRKIPIFKNTNPQDQPIGESFEISRLPKKSAFWNNVSLETATSHEELPYLVKIIDTDDNLSIQVHPDDSYAQKYENESGKCECWLILDSEPGSGIYLGTKNSLSSNELLQAIENQEPIQELLQFNLAKPGDFFIVPPGSIHAIGKGITLLEAQQSSGITYRVWDWNRLDNDGKPRELHLDKALEVINFDPQANIFKKFRPIPNVFQQRINTTLFKHRDFELDYCENGQTYRPIKNRLASVMALGNECLLKCESQILKIPPFSSAFIQGREFSVTGQSVVVR